jgi:hypothetical protein
MVEAAMIIGPTVASYHQRGHLKAEVVAVIAEFSKLLGLFQD